MPCLASFVSAPKLLHCLTRRASLARTAAYSLLAAAVASSLACGGGESTPPTGNNPGNTPGSFTVATLPATVSIVAGATGSVVVNVTRAGSFTGPVSLSLSGVPAGVTATLTAAQIAVGGSLSSISIVTTAATTVGTSTITVTASGSGVSTVTASFQLTVTAPPASNALFTISPSVNSYLAAASSGTSLLTLIPTIDVVRNAGYSGAVTFTVSGLPATIAMGFSPSVVTGASTSTPILNAGAPNGTYTAVIRAVGANGGGERTANLPIVVASPIAGNLTWRICTVGARFPASFVAVKDGNGAWSRVTPEDGGHVFSFNLSQANASVAWVTVDSGVARTTVYNYSQAEMRAAAASDCAVYPDASTRTANGQVTGMASGEQALLGMGYWFASTVNPFGGGTVSSYSMTNLPAGPLDLIAVRGGSDNTFTYNPNRIIVRRALNPASGASNTLLDFASAESFAPSAATWTVGGSNGESYSVSQYFHTAGGSSGQFTLMPSNELTVASRSVFGVPVAQTVAGDLMQTILTIGALAPRGISRQVVAYDRTVGARNINFGPALTAPTVTAASVPSAGLVRAQGTLATEYNSGVTLEVKSTGVAPRYATVHATRAFLGSGSSYDIAMPDLTDVLGWDRNWNIRRGDNTEWWVSGGGPVLGFFDSRYIFPTTRKKWTGAQTGITAPTDGSTYLMARATGNVTP